MKYITDAVEENRDVKIITYSVSTTNENRLKKVLALYLRKRGCQVLLAPLYTCMKELLINAVKANYKHIYFEGDEPQSPLPGGLGHDKVIRLFKLEMSREDAKTLARLARSRGMKAEIVFQHMGDILSITITNPIAMTPDEQEKVRKKLADARKCDDISDYFLMSADDPQNEGAGIGLVLVTMILKSLGVDQSSLDIRSFEDYTRASLVIPLTRTTLEHYARNTAQAAG
ncbi:MAG TPA: hypothetical protein PKO25_07705 [Spirochaetota bacterium]|jgi:hypothetical protein|nr:hypothetical protein [Spirochaetota bacterium]OPZ36819.1 MAG: hypothetical protein BWY96_02011 [Spirochaetes bacterium ADurb.BinA120]HNU91740.1 hypothetical protein [Spirochaetota bacterium]HPI15483.1 hypothetical protein [Spirochaetota bacterium]HPO45591.1 hypothetical protein [Spirochaetota bacterium]